MSKYRKTNSDGRLLAATGRVYKSAPPLNPLLGGDFGRCAPNMVHFSIIEFYYGFGQQPAENATMRMPLRASAGRGCGPRDSASRNSNKKQRVVDLSTTLSSSVGITGFEPVTPNSRSWCANRTALHPDDSVLRRPAKRADSGRDNRIRTCDPLLPKQVR